MEATQTPSSVKRRPWWVRLLAWIGGLVLGVGILVGAGYLYIQSSGNFHVVEDKVLYRSAQLTGSDLTEFVNKYHIRSVINLRGENKGTDWYDEEMAVVQKMHLAHADMSLSAREQLTMQEMQELVRLMTTLPTPVLVHCGGGTDRTGLACALYQISQGRSVEVARRELSIKYGHFPYLGSETDAMDKSLELYLKAQGQR